MIMDLDMIRIINNFLVSVVLTDVVVILFEKVRDGESIKNTKSINSNPISKAYTHQLILLQQAQVETDMVLGLNPIVDVAGETVYGCLGISNRL